MPAKKRRSHPRARHGSRPSPQVLWWLPIDSRLIPQIFSFGSVRGLARVFLETEILLAVLIVLGTLIVLVLRLFAM